MDFTRGVRFFLNRMRERLWVRPLLLCLLSVIAAFLAGTFDSIGIGKLVPEISLESVRELLSILSNSMLVIAVFAVGSMISAYTSASNSATPRAFKVILADDVSQNALSTFIGAFIYGNVALVALLNGYYERAGRFALFILTVIVFAFVIISFVRWVDRIARLGRLGNTVDKVEKAAADALRIHARYPTLGAKPLEEELQGEPVYCHCTGYVQRVNAASLQEFASEKSVEIIVKALPGTFLLPNKPLAYVRNGKPGTIEKEDADRIINAFMIGEDRTFDEDPRFGFIVLSEIASRALSPAVNDPGTAFDIIGTLVQLFDTWYREYEASEHKVTYDRVWIRAASVDDMFSDAFMAIARDGAGLAEVNVRLQKALRSLASYDGLRDSAIKHGRLAKEYAERALKLEQEKEWLNAASEWLDDYEER